MRNEVLFMGNALKILGVLAIVLGLIMGGIGGFLMFSYVPGLLDDAEIPDDLDKHYFYGGWMNKLNTATGQTDRIEFTADRHVTYAGEAGEGHIYINSNITATDNQTSSPLDDLYSDTNYEVHPKKLTLYNVNIIGGSKKGYTRDIPGSENVNYVFPIPAEEEDYQIWSSDILHWTTAQYLGKEEKGGVECYEFQGWVGDLDDPEDRGWEVPLPSSLADMLGPFAEDTKMYLKGWEKAWVHPTTGAIVDYAKELHQYLYLPELPDIPEVIYPSDLMSTSGFEGSLTLFDQTTGTFIPMNGITAERTVEVVESDGYVYTADDEVNVYAPDGSSIDILGSAVQVMFNATDGSHAGMGRTGHYLFPPTGVEMKDYMIWDDGFGKVLTAEYVGNRTFGELLAYEYVIDVENETYLSGGVSSMEMTYWVEVTTGIVLDVDKHVVNWRPQPARRLPTDTSMINKTIHMNATIIQKNPITMNTTTMDIVVEQMINCTGYTDMTYSVAMIEETVTKYYGGMPMEEPSVARFGVNAVTMDYVEAGNWSTVDRAGAKFTFPVGLLNETGDVTPMYSMYNTDLGAVMPAILVEELDFNGLEAAKYEMSLTNHSLDYVQLVAALMGNDPGLPGATGLYTGSTTYIVDIDTGTVLHVEKMTSVSIVPPTYEYLWDNLNSTMAIKGRFGTDDITASQVLVGSEAGEGTTQITISETTKYENGTDFLPPDESIILIDTMTHEMLYPNGTGMGLYFLFPYSPTEAAYPMAQTLGPYTIVSAALRGDETDTTVAYNWTGMEVVDGALIGYGGMNFNLTMWYNYLVDKVSGMVLDVTVDIMLENASQLPDPGYFMLTFAADEATKEAAAMGSQVMAWALSRMAVEVLHVDMELYDMEVAYNVGKAAVTQGLLDVADGDAPALDLHLTFNETTKAGMIANVQATLALLGQLEGLMILHGMNNLLTSDEVNNEVAHVYYKQLDEDPEGSEYRGSVEYHGEESKKVDDAIALYGTTIPIVLYVIAAVLILVGIALIIAGPKEEPLEEEPETEDGEGPEDEDAEE
ncbi:MAG: porin PorA family protein [Thermoplasmatota archaeon]